MKNSEVIVSRIRAGEYDDRFLDVYKDANLIEYQKDRYIKAVEAYESCFGEDDISIYSAPGRSEICGNHTDHQHGRVLASAINLDAIAVVNKTEESIVNIISDGYELISIDLNNLQFAMEEKESTKALIKGVLSGLKDRGYIVGGFNACITSDVLIGAGLSSSAAFETLVGTIVSGLYNNMEISPVEIAIVGQYAENKFFGKPCGLMDQMACSVGEAIYIDFKDATKPIVQKISLDLDKYGYSLCITDTQGSHEDLTPDYAAVPWEMNSVAKILGKEVLCDVTMEELIENAQTIREQAGDRAFIRAIHCIKENERVDMAVSAINDSEFDKFLGLINESGNSSFKYLQNVYTGREPSSQKLSVALALSEYITDGDGATRVHGGGFAGTIQAFVKNEKVLEYKEKMESVFGVGACNVLKIRKYGGIQVI